jgi:hypothetical protein
MGVPILYTCLAPRSAVRTILQKRSSPDITVSGLNGRFRFSIV